MFRLDEPQPGGGSSTISLNLLATANYNYLVNSLVLQDDLIFVGDVFNSISVFKLSLGGDSKDEAKDKVKGKDQVRVKNEEQDGEDWKEKGRNQVIKTRPGYEDLYSSLARHNPEVVREYRHWK